MDIEKIKSVLASLDPKNAGHWTQDGLPKLEIVKLLSGETKATRDDITAIAPELTRESSQKAKDATTLIPSAPQAPLAPTASAEPQAPASPSADTGASLQSVDDEEDLAYEQNKLERMTAYHVSLGQEIIAQQAKVDSMIVAEEGDSEPTHIRNQRAIVASLEASEKRNESRAEMIREFGPTRTVRTVEPSPLDRAIANKRK